MRQPPEPLYKFTIPSVHDDTTLGCRIYHPESLSESLHDDTGTEIQWRPRGVVMAHPYAPMGGSYDDRVVGIVIEEFLKAGWIVGTFNFRGAADSKGRTSWSGRPELDDYTSFAGFFMHYISYISYLRANPAPKYSFTPEHTSHAPQASQSDHGRGQTARSATVILGGYSYGSLILKYLPPVPAILKPFTAPIAGSAHDEIIMRAHKLADQSNLTWINLAQRQARERKLSRTGHENMSPVTMGGEETSPDKRRTSRDIRRSADGHLGTDIGNRLRSLSHRRRKDESTITSFEKQDYVAIIMPEVRYLLISPLTPPLSTLAAPALGRKFWNRSKEIDEGIIDKHATLAVYGDQDMFSSAKKLRDWCQQMSSTPEAQFSSVEIAGAGHFWIEGGVESKLRTALHDWEGSIS